MMNILLKLNLLISLMILPHSVYAVQFMNSKCSKKFIGQVESIEQAPAPVHTFSKDKIVFKVKEKITNNVGNNETLELLKYGPVKVAEGEEYKVHLEKGNICLLEKVN